MPYTGDPANSLSDQVWFLVQDTSATSPALSDEEVAFLLEEEGQNALRAAARAAEILSGKYASESSTKRVGPLMLGDSSRESKADRYAKLAKRLWARAAASDLTPFAGGTSQSDKDARNADTDRVGTSFARDMMKYPNGSPQTATEEDLLF